METSETHCDKRRNQEGQAVTEFAIATMIFVPLTLFGIWFADTLHLGIKATEAEVIPAWDMTAMRVHDYQSGGPYDALYNQAIAQAQQGVLNEMQQSFDSTNPGGSPISASVVARAQDLQVQCQRTNGDGSGPGNAGVFLPANAPTQYLNANSWVTCHSSLDVLTVGFRPEYLQDRFDVPLIPLTQLSLCGLGNDGDGGCFNDNQHGFSVMLDDWALENGAANPLSIGTGGSSGNPQYVNVASSFFFSGTAPSFELTGTVMLPLVLSADLANVGAFRLSYQRGNQGAYDQPENGHGQQNPTAGAGSLKTGGPWNEENPAYPDLSKNTFTNTRVDANYLAIKTFPKDSQ
jgi:hypothetical protein